MSTGPLRKELPSRASYSFSFDRVKTGLNNGGRILRNVEDKN
jgi:hypothetical protein